MQQGVDAELSKLRELARRSGVQVSFRDAFGESRKAAPEPLMHVLRALGVEIASPGAAQAVLAAHERERWDWHVAPVTIAWDAAPAPVDIRLPLSAAGRLTCALRLESGELHEWSMDLEALPVRRRKSIDTAEYVCRRLELLHVPHGYHTLYLATGRFQRSITVIGAPRRTYNPDDGRSWGVFVPLYALHSAETWGCGSYTDLGRFAEWLHGRGGRLISTLPLTPTFLDDPYVPSPYSPVSRLFWNELYIDAARAAAGSDCVEARELLASQGVQAEIARLRATRTVDYRAQMALVRRTVTSLAEHAGASQLAAVDAFAAARPDVAEYARFRAVHERQGRVWPEWPDAAASGRIGADDYNPGVYRYFLYAQWLAESQLAETSQALQSRGQQIYLDLPTGSHTLGYDTWRFRDAFSQGMAAGAPPDLVFTQGQNWGFPPLHPESLRSTGYEYLKLVLQRQMKYADVLRIDHVMGMHRLFWIPEGAGAADGVYVRYPAEEHYAVLNLESHRNRVVVAGENLGLVPDYVNRALAQHGVFETYVMQYEIPWQEGGGLRTPSANAVASLNTHDMPPFAGYLTGSDIQQRRDLGMITDEWVQIEGAGRDNQHRNLDRIMREQGLLADSAEPGDIMRASIDYLARSPARYVLVNVEDLWLETEPQNIPGSPESAPELDGDAPPGGA